MTTLQVGENISKLCVSKRVNLENIFSDQLNNKKTHNLRFKLGTHRHASR